MKNLILIAPPGAGKGTQAKMLCKKYNLVHISIGDLLRSQTDLNESLKEKIKKGVLIDDNIIFDLLKNRLNKDDIKNGFILDGFPRNLNQAIGLENIIKNIDVVIYLEVPKKELENRILGRIICSNCGHVYNSLIEKLRPTNNDICDICNSKLEKRIDDTLEVFEKRYDTYIKETQPVLEFYKKQEKLYTINLLDKDEIFNEIVRILK